MGNHLKFRSTQSARAIYARPFLLHELMHAADMPDDEDFARFQCEAAARFSPDFKPDTLSVSILNFTADGVFTKVEYCCAHNQPAGTLKLYSEHHDRDVMARANWLAPGSAIFNTIFKSWDEWLDDEFYQLFKKPLGLHHTVVVNYRYPLKQRFSIRFGYQTEAGNTFGDGLSKDEVEYFTLPFLIAWLYRMNSIDRETMEGWLSLIEGLTPLRLALLRDLTNETRYRRQSMADKLRVSARAVSNQLAEIHGAILHLLGPTSGEGDQSKAVDLANAFGFLRFVGRFETDAGLHERMTAAGMELRPS